MLKNDRDDVMYDELTPSLGINDYCTGGWTVPEGLMGHDWVVTQETHGG